MDNGETLESTDLDKEDPVATDGDVIREAQRLLSILQYRREFLNPTEQHYAGYLANALISAGYEPGLSQFSIQWEPPYPQSLWRRKPEEVSTEVKVQEAGGTSLS